MSQDMTRENVLPAAVQKQVDQANAIIEQMKDQPEAPENPELQQEVEVSAQEAPEAPAPEQEAPAPEQKAERTDWKHKYSVLQGKYDAEVPRLNEELRESRTMLREQGDQINRLTATVESMKTLSQQTPEAPKELVTQEEIDQFGPDLIDIVKRVAQQTMEPYVENKVGEVKQSVQQVNENVASTREDVAKSARDRLYARLDAEVADWEALNKDPVFLEWLRGLPHELAEEPRGVALRRAFESNDANRVVKFFKSFQAEHVVENTDPGPAASSEETPAEEPQQNLEELVAPGTPKTGSTDAPTEGNKRIWTRRDIEAFYAEKNEWIRKHSGKPLPDRITNLERDLFSAQAEGRLR
jgi:hypothetical protein